MWLLMLQWISCPSMFVNMCSPVRKLRICALISRYFATKWAFISEIKNRFSKTPKLIFLRIFLLDDPQNYTFLKILNLSRNQMCRWSSSRSWAWCRTTGTSSRTGMAFFHLQSSCTNRSVVFNPIITGKTGTSNQTGMDSSLTYRTPPPIGQWYLTQFWLYKRHLKPDRNGFFSPTELLHQQVSGI